MTTATVSTLPGAAQHVNSLTRYGVLLGGIIIQLILGTVYGYSIFWEPLNAEVFPPVITEADRAQMIAEGVDISGYTVVADAEARRAQIAAQQGYLKYAFSICILSFAGVMVFAGRIQDIKGPRFPAVVGAFLMGVGFLLASLMNYPIVFYLAHAVCVGVLAIALLLVYETTFGRLNVAPTSILQHVPMGIVATVIVAGVVLGNQYVGRLGHMDKLLLLWGTIGFLAGAGIGFAYVCPIAALVKWFPQHKGLVSGLAVAGFGFGAYLFSGKTFGAVGFINRTGIVPFFAVHGLVCLIGILIGAMLLRNPPGTQQAKTAITPDSTWQDMLRRPAFYMLWLMFFSGAMAGLMVIGIVKVFAGEQLVTAARESGRVLDNAQIAELMLKGAAAVGWLAIFNAIGRIVWGLISDRIGRTPTFVAMFLFQAIVMVSLGLMRTELTIAVAASIVGFNFGGNFALFPSATADLFGAKNLGANYGWVFTSYGIAGVVGIAAGNTAKMLTGSYSAAFWVAAVLCAISAGLAVVLAFNQKRAATTQAH